MTLHLLHAATMPVIEPAIEQLRATPVHDEQPPVNFDQFCRLSEMITDASYCRKDIEDELGIDTETLVQAIVELARFMLATKGNPNVKVLGTWSEVHGASDITPLPGLANAAPAPASKRRLKASSVAVQPVVSKDVTVQPGLVDDNGELLIELPNAKKSRTKAPIAKAVMPEPVRIVLPDGFSKAEIGRDINGSIEAIVALQPSTDDITRFIQRHYKRAAHPLSFEMLCAVWTFARLNRVKGLGRISEAPGFVRNCVAAWDTLEISRQDAMTALAVLATSRDSNALSAAAAKLTPVWEAEAKNFQNLLEAGGSDSAAFIRAQAWLHKRLSAGQLIVGRVSMLNEGQVRRIAMLVGLDTEVISRNEETYIRGKLADMNLAADAEQLVPIGVAAIRAGLEESFFDACAKRADGDQDWGVELESLLFQRQ
jgi:hypothetical protein